MEEDHKPTVKPRPVVRIGILLISHSLLVSIVCCTAGLLALLLLPVLAKNTYVSENALMPGSANPMLSSQDVMEADGLVKELTSLNMKGAEPRIHIPRLLGRHLAALGAEVNHHRFYPQFNQFHPLHFFSTPDSAISQGNLSCSNYGVSTIGIIRAPRGDGKEAIVLVTPYNSMKISQHEALSIGIAYSVFSLLTRVTWLAKDIIWLAADSEYGEYAPVATWLREYHSPAFKLNEEVCCEIDELNEKQIIGMEVSDSFRRAGTMAAALVIKVVDGNEEVERDMVRINAEAANGQMPNLDLINVVNYLAVHRQGLRVEVEKCWSLLHSKWIKAVGEILELIGKVATSLNPRWKFGVPVTDYVEGTATLASSLYKQALGIPTGSHGAFRDYQVDSITLEISPKFSMSNKARRSEFLLRSGRLIEGVVRSVNNLLEKFHQSFFLYLLTSPSKFISVGVYMIAFALLIAPLPIVAASLYSDSSRSTSSPRKDIHRSWKWLHAAKLVFIVHLWGIIVSLLPYFISQINNFTPTTSFFTWVLLSSSILFIMYLIIGSPENRNWIILKSMTISYSFIGLCTMSVINFATAELGALLMVPMCLMAQPLKLSRKTGSLKAIARSAFNLVLGFTGFPPVAYIMLKGIIEGFNGVSVGDFWKWVEALWAWNSATYLYICMVYLPCWVLCIQLIFHRC